MSVFPAAWPPWLAVCCAVSLAGIVIWILSRILKWVFWLVLLAVLAAGAVMAARMFLR